MNNLVKDSKQFTSHKHKNNNCFSFIVKLMGNTNAKCFIDADLQLSYVEKTFWKHLCNLPGFIFFSYFVALVNFKSEYYHL